MFVLVVLFICILCSASDSRPFLEDRNALEELEGDFEIQPREPVFFGIFFLLKTIFKLGQYGYDKYQQTHPPKPNYPTGAAGTYYVPAPMSKLDSFRAKLWYILDSLQRKLGVNPNNYEPLPPHLLPRKAKSTQSSQLPSQSQPVSVQKSP